MLRRHLVHPNGLPTSTTTSAEIACEETGGCATQVARKSVDDLLRAFSDVAFSSDEEDLNWESWNYSRLSFF